MQVINNIVHFDSAKERRTFEKDFGKFKSLEWKAVHDQIRAGLPKLRAAHEGGPIVVANLYEAVLSDMPSPLQA
jgi:hypothetical protein